MEKFKELCIGRQIIIIGSLMTIVSLLLDWGAMGFIEANGFELHAFLIIFALIYPLYNSYQNKDLDKKKAMISLCIGLAFIFYVRIVAFRNYFGNVPGLKMLIGMKMAIVGIIIAMIGVRLNKNNEY